MAKELKYIVVEQNGIKIPILFDDTLSHDCFKSIFNDDIVSAGFFNADVKNGKIVVATFGRSISMKMESQAKDTTLIEKFLNNFHI